MGKGELLWYPRETEGNKQGVDTPASLTLPLDRKLENQDGVSAEFSLPGTEWQIWGWAARQ